MKLSVIGGGGVRSPFLAKSLVENAAGLGIDEIVFMDENEEKLALFGKISSAVANKIDSAVRFSTTTDDVAAIKDADYVITTIRSSGDKSRVFDERVALDMGILGQETTGAAGFAMALRSVPILIELCEKIKTHAKDKVMMFNFTNPSGLVAQALRDEGYDFVYGICDAPSNFEKQLIRLLGEEDKEFEMTCFGLNHLSWFRDFKLDGQDVYDRLMAHPDIFSETELRYFDKEVVRMIGDRDFPNEYLYFYYYRDQAVKSILDSGITRGETIYNINLRMIEHLKQVDIDSNPEEAFNIFISHYYEREDQYFAIESGTKRKATKTIPSLDDFVSEPDGGGYAGVALDFIRAYTGGKPVKMVLSVPNNGAIGFLRDNDVVEISCKINEGKVEPVTIDHVDDYQKTLIGTIKYFERQTIKAIKERDKSAAVKALAIHPQINSYPLALSLLESYLETYKDYVGEWH